MQASTLVDVSSHESGCTDVGNQYQNDQWLLIVIDIEACDNSLIGPH